MNLFLGIRDMSVHLILESGQNVHLILDVMVIDIDYDRNYHNFKIKKDNVQCLNVRFVARR